MSLSVCLLTRDEESFILRAMRSVAGVADEVVVADAGSRDRTMQIATEMGARVFSFSWEDDLAAGRNFLVEQARGKWILWLAADEELLESSHWALRDCLLRGDVFATTVQVQEPIGAGQYAEAADLRLFRRRSDLRFSGRLHPAVSPEMVQQVALEGQHVTSSSIVLRTPMVTPQRRHLKLRSMQRLLELELSEHPSELRFLIEYGSTLLALHDPRGHSLMADASRQVSSARNAQSAPSPYVQVLLEYLLTVDPSLNQCRLAANDAYELAVRWFSSSPRLLFKCAEIAFARNDYASSKQILERLLELGRTGIFDRSVRYQSGLMGDDALINLGACCEYLGERDAAEACYLHLLEGFHSNVATIGLKRLGRKHTAAVS